MRDNIEILEVLDSGIGDMLDKRNEVDRLHYVANIYNYLIDTFPITSETQLRAKGVDLFEHQTYVEALPPEMCPPLSTIVARYEEIIYRTKKHAYCSKAIGSREAIKLGYHYVEMTELVCDYDKKHDRFVMSVKYHQRA